MKTDGGGGRDAKMEDNMSTSLIIASPYPLMQEGIKAMLSDVGDVTVIDTATTCAEVDAKIEKVSPDIIIIDLQLSDFCGFDRIKSYIDINPSIRFLFISNLDNGKYFEEAISKGACGFILNSVNKDELVAAVKSAIANEVYVQPKLAKEIFKMRVTTDGNLVSLPPRQQQILEFMAEGFSNKEIASQLGLSIETINTHVKQILKKLKARDRAQAVAIAFRRLLIR
ncbi:MAG: response regulator transcription factor [Firmicutes bacterium]|nr:response regulator transcription factor [Bacillota bacterium]